MPRHCFSQLVNFDAIARYFYGIGGDALLPQKSFSSLSICAFLAHHSDDKFPATRAAHQETQSTFGPDDLFALMSWLNAHLEEVSIVQALALLRLTRWDTTAFLRLFPVICRQLRSVAAERNDLRQAVLNTWANRYPVSPAENVLAFNCGVVLLELRFFAEALPLFKSPSICLGVPLPPVTTWGCALWGSADPLTRWLIWSTPATRIPPSSRPGTHESGWKKRKPRADCHEARPRNSAIQSCWAAAACIGNKNQPCSAFAATPLICTTSIYTQENCSRGERIMRHRTVTLFLLFSFLLASAAWGREDRLTNTGVAPAAEGKIITDTDRSGNTGIEIHVKHLATPQSLTPPRQGYLVWIQPRGKDPELLGAIRVNADLEGSLKTATTYKDFEVLITAEDNMKPDTPSSIVVLKGMVERK
ncbi:MAG: hypothetical protein ACXVKH_14400 [Candidatus Angelobacter sp.]